jgi:hypothetical protein
MNTILDRTAGWIWFDKTRCPTTNNNSSSSSSSSNNNTPQSALTCYFGKGKDGMDCLDAATTTTNNTMTIIPPLKFGRKHPAKYGLGKCDELVKQYTLKGIRAAATEWLFQSVSPIVLKEAERQVLQAFGAGNTIPSSLITIHVRWGDKHLEMKLVEIDAYVNATKELLTPEERQGNHPVSIYLASEDPRAILEFHKAAPSTWNIYSSGPTNAVNNTHMSNVAVTSQGAAGLESIAALLIAMEANRYILTTNSNWSRLINELRKNVVDPRCGNCTTMVDLREAEYE